MSDRVSVSKLSGGDKIDQVFMITQPILRKTTRGDDYIAAYLSDATGKLNSRMWQASKALYDSLPKEGFVLVKGKCELYQGNMQLVIDRISGVDPETLDLSSFLPATKQDIEVMFTRVAEILGMIQDPHLQQLAQAFLNDEEKMTAFKKSPAAMQLHHAFLGGLLEHTHSLLELAVRVMPHYRKLNSDLVILGIFLHDMGKIIELECNIAIKYSDEGQLIGHIVQGILMIERKIDEISQTAPFPKVLRDSLMHIVASHHGLREYGSPVLPATPEAFAVHHLDNLDSKIELALSTIENDTTGVGNWTGYIRSIETRLYKPPVEEVPLQQDDIADTLTLGQ